MSGKKNKERSLQVDKIKKFNIFDQPEKVASPEGAHIYEWEYLDEDGKIQKDKKNIFEMG